MGKIVKGLVFGVFDGFHQGHQYFLKEAASKCQKLMVVVARSETVEAMKKRTPKYSLEERISAVRSFDTDLVVIPGDKNSGEWKVLKDQKPDIVLLGYDQKEIASELDKMSIPYIYLAPHQPEKYKSSLSSS